LSPEFPSNAERPIVFSFEPSRELDLQEIILGSMSSGGGSSKIWIEATFGTYDGAVATGFARSLMREIVAVDIRLVLFDPIWQAESRFAAIEQLSGMTSLEPEIALDNTGRTLVPRLRSYSPRALDTLDHNRYWVVDQPNTVLQSAPPLPGPDQVLVKITVVSDVEGGLQGIVGTVERSRSAQWRVGAQVVAIVPSTRSNFVLVHDGQIADISQMSDVGSVPSIALLLVFVALGLRLDLRPLPSLQRIQVVVLHTGKFASSIARLLEHLGVKPLLIAPSFPLVLPRLSPGDIIMCGLSADSARTIPRIRGVSVFNWADADHGALTAVTQNPWLVGTTIHAHLTPALLALNVNGGSLRPEQLLPPTFEVSQSLALTDDKFYVILGGIGSLGLQIAIWMYRVSTLVFDYGHFSEKFDCRKERVISH
jgi:hypothetical protein